MGSATEERTPSGGSGPRERKSTAAERYEEYTEEHDDESDGYLGADSPLHRLKVLLYGIGGDE